MMDLNEIARLLELLRKGDGQARNDLISYAGERLRALTRRMMRHYPLVRSKEQTDDVLQNAMMRLHRSLETMQPELPRHFLNLATQQIRRALIDMARRYMKQGVVRHFSDAGADAEAPADSWADVRNEPNDLESWSAFHEAVESLPADERGVFDILWYDDRTQDQAAELLDVSPRTVKRRWQSARILLSEALRPREEGR